MYRFDIIRSMEREKYGVSYPARVEELRESFFSSHRHAPADRFYYALGGGVLAPLFVGFCGWAMDIAVSEGVKRIFPLMRDGILYVNGEDSGLYSAGELEPGDRVRQLSSGMAAKLRLALTLSRDAGLMMFDEPLNGVDILTRTQTIDAILAGRREGRTMLISTHLVDELEDVVDYTVFLKKGKLVMAGPKADICAGRTLKELYLEVYGHTSFDPEHTSKEVSEHA